MCGVIGFSGEPNIPLLRKVFWESNIRGQHASGLSWFSEGELRTVRSPGPGAQDNLFREVQDHLRDVRVLIGHARYSTSSLKFNQPMSGTEMAIVHNGVISQELPERWPSLYGYSCETENDSELVLRCLENGKHPLLNFPEASMAACVLTKEGLKFFRNGKRPLWFSRSPSQVVVASTRDILLRSGFGNPEPCYPGVEYQVSPDGLLHEKAVLEQVEDLQHAHV